MSNLRNTRPTGIISSDNSTSETLAIGATYTGTAELNDYTGVLVAVSAEGNGTLFVEFAKDQTATEWTSLPFVYDTSRINAPHQFEKGIRHFRVRFENTSGASNDINIITSFGSFGKLTAPINGTLAENYDATVVRPTEYRLEVAMGKRQGRTTWNKFGFNRDVDSGSEEVVASFGGAFNIMTTADTLDIVSSSANDTSDGTGARTVFIDGIGADFLRQTEIVTMNGVTPVTTANTWLGVNRATVLSSGSLTYNDGDIDIKDTSDIFGTLQAQLPAQGSVTEQCVFHTQINHNFLADWVKINCLKLSGGGSPRVQIKAYSFSRVTLTRYNILELNIDTTVENTIDFATTHPFVLGGREVLYFTASTTVNNTEVTLRFSGIEERVL